MPFTELENIGRMVDWLYKRNLELCLKCVKIEIPVKLLCTGLKVWLFIQIWSSKKRSEI